jgi:WD40 repeat protein
LASCDASGTVKLWDLRKISELASVDFGTQAANKIAFDPSGNTLAVASSDGSCKLYSHCDVIINVSFNVREKTPLRDLSAHEDGVQAVVFDRTAEYFVSAGSDGTVKLWN